MDNQKNRPGPPDFKDRRSAARHPLVRFAWFKTCEDTGNNVEGLCKTFNLSTTGVGLFTTTPLPLGKKIFIEIDTDQFTLCAVGKIVYNNPTEQKTFRNGVEFIVLPPNSRILLEKHFPSHE